MFKKTLIAAALMSAGLSTAFAGEITISGDAYKVGNEYLAAYTGSALEGDLQTGAIGITYKAGIALGEANTLKFVFDGGAIKADTGLKLQKVTGFADHADDATIQADIDTAVGLVADATDTTLPNLTISLNAAKAAAIKEITDAVALDSSIDGSAAITAINAVNTTAGDAVGKPKADVIAVNEVIKSNLIPTAATDVADLVDFGQDANNNYTWVLFKVTDATLVTDTLLFNDTAVADGAANVVTAFTKATIGTGDLTIAMTEAKDGTGADLAAPVAAAKTLVTTVDQFKVELTKAEDKIDVEQERKFFAPTTGDKVSETFTYDVTETTVALGIDSAAATFTAKLDGSMAGVDKVTYDSATAAAVDFADATVAGSKIEDATVVVTVDGTTVLDTRTIGINMLINPNEADTQDFYLVGAVKTFSPAFVWDLNGSQVDIPYMPYSSTTAIGQIIYVVNEGQQVGDISIDAWTEDGTKVLENVLLGQTVKEGTTPVAGQIRDALTAEGITDGKVRMKLVSNVPVADVEVYSAYNVNGADRGLVINSSNK